MNYLNLCAFCYTTSYTTKILDCLSHYKSRVYESNFKPKGISPVSDESTRLKYLQD
jgi:hypothetical protein